MGRGWGWGIGLGLGGGGVGFLLSALRPAEGSFVDERATDAEKWRPAIGGMDGWIRDACQFERKESLGFVAYIAQYSPSF